MSEFEISFETRDVQECIQEIHDELENYDGDVQAYLAWLDNGLGGKSMGRQLVHTARIIEPVDRSLGLDSDAPSATAFYSGGLLGLRVAQELLGSGFDAELADQTVSVVDVEQIQGDQLEKRHRLAANVVNICDQSYAEVEVFHPLIESMEDEMADVRYQQFIKRGFGLVMLQTAAALEERSLHAFDEEVANTNFDSVNWGELLDE